MQFPAFALLAEFMNTSTRDATDEEKTQQQQQPKQGSIILERKSQRGSKG